ncbi:hypothetical protein Anapl_11407 [Anas platyrhynchos]|uniref:Uncharacterized protein n=1 Tax=Anas platyrhynchos TaxID=8839 RepID=R0KX18_ANAPL|nr:hypothetical protein Anapl_11407 [Anas platyrhynchos]
MGGTCLGPIHPHLPLPYEAYGTAELQAPILGKDRHKLNPSQEKLGPLFRAFHFKQEYHLQTSQILGFAATAPVPNPALKGSTASSSSHPAEGPSTSLPRLGKGKKRDVSYVTVHKRQCNNTDFTPIYIATGEYFSTVDTLGKVQVTGAELVDATLKKIPTKAGTVSGNY